MIEFEINFKNYIINYTGIDSIFLFGSYARRENDKYSDIDILIIINDCDKAKQVIYKKEIALQLDLPVKWISVYTKNVINEMHNKGVYFLWHIKLEGQLLYKKSNFMDNILDTLPIYNGMHKDLAEYQEICYDVLESIKYDESTLNYEMSILASLVRNICITMSYMDGNFIFGRRKPVAYCSKLMKNSINFSLNDYDQLYKFRNGSIEFPANRDIILFWIKNIQDLLNFAYKMEAFKNVYK